MSNSLLDDLPEKLAYLKRPAEDIASQDQELIGCGEVDMTVFETAIRTEMSALDPADADIRCAEHHHKLKTWLQDRGPQNDPHFVALHVIAALFNATQDILNPRPGDEEEERLAPEFQPRSATIALPDEFEINRFNEDTVALHGSVELVVREIDGESFASLSQEFSSPRRKTTAPDGTVTYPQSSVSLSSLTGTMNVTEHESTRETIYLLQSSRWFAMVRLIVPRGMEVSEYESLFDSIDFH